MVHVSDSFLPYPRYEREKALKEEYKTIVHNGTTYRGIAVTEDPLAVALLETTLGMQFKDPIVFYRRYLEGEKNDTYIHSDVQIGDYTAIVYLSNPRQCRGGTAFWKHKKLDIDAHPRNLEECADKNIENSDPLWKEVFQDGFDESKWFLTEFVPMKFNRMIFYASNKFHSLYPREAFGSDLQTSRLIKIFFLRVA